MDALVRDLRHALRQLARAPGFTLLAAAILALAIGANTALFSFANAILWHPRPGVHDPGRLVWVSGTPDGHPAPLSLPDFRELRAAGAGAFTGLAASAPALVPLSGGGAAEGVNGQLVTGDFFAVLGASVALGRGIVPADDAAGAPPVVVLGHELWERRFGARPGVVGSTVVVYGLPAMVVGVAAPGFTGAGHGPRIDAWLPLSLAPRARPDLAGGTEERGTWWLDAVGRLRPGVGTEEADAVLAVAAARIAREHPEAHRGWGVRTFPARAGVHPADQTVMPAMLALSFALPGLVLLIACANVSSLLLGRAAARRREIGIRLSLGAGRGRLVRQLLTESLLLAALASAGGLILAVWGTELFVALFPIPFPVLDLRPDARVLAFCAGAAVLTSVAFGLVPALDATRADVAEALKDGAAGPDRRRSRLQGRFVAAQVALSLALLAAAALFLRSAGAEAAVEPGFDASERVLALSFDLGMQGYPDARAEAFVRAAVERARALPGVTAVSVTDQVPLARSLHAAEALPEAAPGARPVEAGRGAEVVRAAVRPGFFAALEIPLARGRDVAASDAAGAPGVAVVSERLARELWPGRDPLGRRLSVAGPRGPWLTVVGVAREAQFAAATGTGHATVYVAQAQHPDAKSLTLLVRAADDARPLAAPLRRELRALDPDLPVAPVKTLAAYRRDGLAETRVGSALLGLFGGLALLLAAVGVYGVAAFAVSQRTREIGVRMALGARALDVVGLFVRQALRRVAVGGAVGMVLAIGVARLLGSVLYGVGGIDLVSVAAAAGVMALAAVLASWLPARRAARVDPLVALRAD